MIISLWHTIEVLSSLVTIIIQGVWNVQDDFQGRVNARYCTRYL